jgi:hypothetical protein
MTAARLRGWPPALAVPPLPGAEPPQILAVAPGAGRAMGMVVGPGAPTQRSQTRHGKLFPRAFIRPESPLIRLIDLNLSGLKARTAGGPAGDQVFKTASMGRPWPRPSLRWFPAALRLHSQSAIPHQPELGAAPLGYADSRTSSPPAPTILVVPLGWKQRRSRRTAGSPHPCVIHGSTRPATILGLPRFDGQGRWLGQAA